MPAILITTPIRAFGSLNNRRIPILLFSLITLFALAGCAKRLKPWNNPDLIKIEREDITVLLADITMWGYVKNKNGSKGVKFNIYFNEDGTSEIIVWPNGRIDSGWWDKSDPNATYCTWYKNLKGGNKDCWLLYKVKGSDRYEYYFLDGTIRGIINKTKPGYHM